MNDKTPRIPKWIKVSLAVLALLILIFWLVGAGGTVRDAEAATGKVTLCNKSGQCVKVTQAWIDRGKLDPTKVRSWTERVAVASKVRNEVCTSRIKFREFPNLFGKTLAVTRLRKSWCYHLRTGRITYVAKPSLAYELTKLGSNTGWDDAGDSISESWIPSGNVRHWAHETIASVKFRRCAELFFKICLGSARINTRIVAYGNGVSSVD